jgi:hypothetical protein
MRYWIVLGFFFVCSTTTAQEGDKNWSISGYVKDLVTINVADDSTLVDNLVHNRLNFSWDPNEAFNVQIEVRNRLFFGDLVSSIPNYGKLVDVNNDYLDLSYYTPENKDWLFHTMIDRAYVEWVNEKWEARIGRQRINWGVNLVWNPNDIFNSYSFFDFDYEERPGSDALRIKRYISFASSMELAVSVDEDFDKTVMAGMYKFNTNSYDIQLFVGKAREDLAAGLGWAGNLGDAGLKGEVSYFHPYNDNFMNNALLASITLDYNFESSLYLHGSYLYNSDGSSDILPAQLAFNTSGRLTVRDLSLFRHSTFIQASYSFHPLINGGLATIYYPSTQAFFINPNVTFSIKPNLDADLIGQLYYDDLNGDFKAQARLFFIRLKWSF